MCITPAPIDVQLAWIDLVISSAKYSWEARDPLGTPFCGSVGPAGPYVGYWVGGNGEDIAGVGFEGNIIREGFVREGEELKMSKKFSSVWEELGLLVTAIVGIAKKHNIPTHRAREDDM